MDNDFEKLEIKITELSEADLAQYIIQSPPRIGLLDNVSEELQIKAIIATNGRAFQYIKNPSLDATKTAVSLNGYNIKHVKKQTTELQWLAVKDTKHTIRYCINPPDAMQIWVINYDPNFIDAIENPCEAAQILAVKYNGAFIKKIKNPSLTVQFAAIDENSISFLYINNPSRDVMVYAFEKDCGLIAETDIFVDYDIEITKLVFANAHKSYKNFVLEYFMSSIAVGHNNSAEHLTEIIGHVKCNNTKVTFYDN